MSYYELGLQFRQTYIPIRELPPLPSNAAALEFLAGICLPDFSILYATNREVLEQIAGLMDALGIWRKIRPFNNCDCRYALDFDPEAFRVATAGVRQSTQSEIFS